MSGIFDGAINSNRSFNSSGLTPIQIEYLQTASKAIRQGNYEVGSEVTVLKEFTNSEYRVLGLPLAQWGPSMDSKIGRNLIITRIDEFQGTPFQFKLSDGCVYPIHVLKATSTMASNYPSVREEPKRDRSAETAEFVESFDLDRLEKECNEVFQNILGESQITLDVMIEDSTTKFNQSITHASDEHITMFMKEIERGRTIIQLPDSRELPIHAMDHPVLKSVVKSIVLHKKAMLVGPAGTGKTYMVAQLATRMNLPFYKYSCSRDSSVHDLLGYKQPASETYLETVFLKAYEQGGIFLVDEYDAMSGDMALFFNGIADGSKFISIPHRDEKPIAEKHKDFHIVMCGNTWGKGSHEFTGRDFQDNALMDRFRLCRHFVGYHIELEKSLAGPYYPVLKQMRTILEEKGSYLSTRNVEDISFCVNGGIDINDVMEMIAEDLIEADKADFKASLSRSISQHRRDFVAYSH